MGTGFSPTGFFTGGLAGPASVISHPSLKNAIGGGAFTQAVHGPVESQPANTTTTPTTLLAQPSGQTNTSGGPAKAMPAAAAMSQSNLNPISLTSAYPNGNKTLG